MTIDSLLSELNEHQRVAASMQCQHALVLAGAGCGKTKTIVARAAFLISDGTPSHRIQILTFTRRAASEIVERVRMHLGDEAKGLRASTFHTWCISLIRQAPSAFGCKDYSVIDRDDQLQLFKVVRGKKSTPPLPTAAQLCDLYSFARNTGQTLYATLLKNSPDSYGQKERIAQVMLAYEARKRDRRYLDYDDILDVVAQQLSTSPETCSWVASQYDHMLVDELQDTNPLQWKLIDPLKSQVTLFCVGDDAQSIYGFRGADFRNVHSFSERVADSVTLKLEKNYRSTQEILDASNWLLSKSPLNYEKHLVAARGCGNRPQLHTFANEWEEGRWIADDLIERRVGGANWQEHMILVRSAFAAKVMESSLLAKKIPYIFIGGTKLMESAHVRDVLSVLRLVANPHDEIGWMRFLTLWNGVGEVTANQVIERILTEQALDGCIQAMKDEAKIPTAALTVVQIVRDLQTEVSKAVANAVSAMEEVLSAKYRNQEWDKRRRDFRLVEKLAEKHSSILAFIEEYLLDPVHAGTGARTEDQDIVTIITVHSAKGTEREVCYVLNVSPGAYPSSLSAQNDDEVEEERRVLYVALTRAKDELIVTRRGYALWSQSVPGKTDDEADVESYFFNALPDGMFDEHVHTPERVAAPASAPQIKQPISVGIKIGDIEEEATVRCIVDEWHCEFVWVSGGSFEMGDVFGDGKSNERPVHQVNLDGFWLGKHPVTQGEWKKVMGNNPSFYKGDDCPVEMVCWGDIQQFIMKLNERGDGKYRLPTEAEWEYAARSGGKKERYAGGDDIDRVAWHKGNSCGSTHPVGQKAPNGLGLYDMSGNVWEWVSDWFDSEYYAKSPRDNPEGPSGISNRVIRGGGFGGSPADARCAARLSFFSRDRGNGLGFRLLRTNNQPA